MPAYKDKQSANPDMMFQNLYELYMEDMIPRLKQSTIMTKKHICETHIHQHLVPTLLSYHFPAQLAHYGIYLSLSSYRDSYDDTQNPTLRYQKQNLLNNLSIYLHHYIQPTKQHLLDDSMVVKKRN